MQLTLSSGSRVEIDLRATGFLRAIAHDPTLIAPADTLVFDAPDGPLDLPLTVSFRVSRIEPPASLGASDRDKMKDNLMSNDVLDAAHHPTVDFRGRFAGTHEGGRVAGELVVRGKGHAVAFPVGVAREGDVLVATGTWEGRLTELGIKPFKALLGAIRLDDWVRLRLTARLS